MKFQRTYSLLVEGNALAGAGIISPPTAEVTEQLLRTIRIDYPLTLDLEVVRNTLASANTARLTIYNLSESTRRLIFHDRYDTLNYRRVELAAGYLSQSDIPIIFKGNMIVAGSRRAGPNWITEIECFDGGFGTINGQASVSQPAGWSVRDLAANIVAGMPNLGLNAVGAPGDARNSRGVTIVGNAWSALQGLAGDGYAFVDLEKVNILAENEYILSNGAIPVINGETGLLNAPRRQGAIIELDVLFEPHAVVGQVVEVQSLESVNDGVYQVRGVRHAGRISGAFDGGVVTTLSLWIGTSRLNAVQPLSFVPGAPL